MSDEILVRSSYELFSTTNEIKRHLLYFDKIAIHGIKDFIEFHYLADQSDGTDTYGDLEYLCEKDIFYEPDINWSKAINTENTKSAYEHLASTSHELQNYVGAQVLDENTMTKEFIQKMGDLQGLKDDFFARLLAAQLSESGKVNAFAMLSRKSSSFTIPNKCRRDVVDIVIATIPIPDEMTPWEAIFDYRKDPNSKKHLHALRHWINQLSLKNFSEAEISDEIQFLIDEYESHMHFHKIKFSMGTLETVIIAGAEFIENILKLRFSNALRQLIIIKNHKLSILEAELKAPGRELAYIVNCKNTFENSDGSTRI